MRGFLKSIVFFSALLLGLEAIMRLLAPSPAAFALPSEVLQGLPYYLLPDKFGIDVLVTLGRTLIAFFFAFPLGLLIGTTAYKFPIVSGELRGMVDFLRSIPGTSLVPVFFVIFGIGEAAKIGAAIYGAALTVAISTIVGLSTISNERRRTAESMYGKANMTFLRFDFPEILPTLLVGLRTSISLSLVLVTVSEMFIGTDVGLGSVIMDSRYAGRIPELYISIFMTGLLGYLLNKAASLFENLASSAYPKFH
jgi:NitT/TauT family transport system permease protein